MTFYSLFQIKIILWLSRYIFQENNYKTKEQKTSQEQSKKKTYKSSQPIFDNMAK